MTNDEKEQLAIAQGLYKALGEIVSTKNPNSLRGRADAEIMADAANRKKSTIELYINDTYVGCISPIESKAETRIIVEDPEAALGGIVEDTGLDGLPQDIVQKIADWYFKKTGAVPDGCSAYAEPKRISGTKITGCGVDAVSSALGVNLMQAAIHLLGAGEEVA